MLVLELQFVLVLLCYMSFKQSKSFELMDDNISSSITAAWHCSERHHCTECFLSVCSWVWCAACCRWAPASVLRRLKSQGLRSSRSWSWSCRVDWPWDSAPAPTAPRPWADPRARHRLPENPMTQYVTLIPQSLCFPFLPLLVCHPRETPQPHAITHCLRQNHFKCQVRPMCGNLSQWL